MELNEKDKELIAKIDERLKVVEEKLLHSPNTVYGPIENNVDYPIILKKTGQPDNEVEYVEFIKPIHDIKVGQIFPIDFTSKPKSILTSMASYNYERYSLYVKPATREAYLAQTTPVNGEWKVGEWAWSYKDKSFLGTIKEIRKGSILEVLLDNQDGKCKVFFKLELLEIPTKEEIEQHLVKIAKEKYPIGTKVKEVGTDVEYTVTHDGYRYVKSLNDLSFISLEEEWDKGHSNPTIWQNGVWAEPITEQKERWKITIEPFNYSPNDYRIVIACISGTVLSYNEANKIAEAIRETLKNI